MPKTCFFVFVLGSSINNVHSAFLSLPAYFIFFALELFLLSCFMNVSTVTTSLLIWTLPQVQISFQIQGFRLCCSFYRHRSIRKWDNYPSNYNDCRWTRRTTTAHRPVPLAPSCLASLPAGPERFSLSVQTDLSPFSNDFFIILFSPHSRAAALCDLLMHKHEQKNSERNKCLLSKDKKRGSLWSWNWEEVVFIWVWIISSSPESGLGSIQDTEKVPTDGEASSVRHKRIYST